MKRLKLPGSAHILCAIILIVTVAYIALSGEIEKEFSRAASAIELNSSFRESISRLHRIDAGLNRTVRRGTVIFPGNSDHPVFAAEEVENTARWYDALINAPRYTQLDDSLKTILADMGPEISDLQMSFEKLRSISPANSRERAYMLDTELEENIFTLVSSAESFVSINSQNFLMNRSTAVMHRRVLTWIFFLIVCGAFTVYFIVLRRRKDGRG